VAETSVDLKSDLHIKRSPGLKQQNRLEFGNVESSADGPVRVSPPELSRVATMTPTFRTGDAEK
jgi:hypothetical protein